MKKYTYEITVSVIDKRQDTYCARAKMYEANTGKTSFPLGEVWGRTEKEAREMMTLEADEWVKQQEK